MCALHNVMCVNSESRKLWDHHPLRGDAILVAAFVNDARTVVTVMGGGAVVSLFVCVDANPRLTFDCCAIAYCAVAQFVCVLLLLMVLGELMVGIPFIHNCTRFFARKEG